MADSRILSTNCHFSSSVSNFGIVSQAVPEKYESYLTKKVKKMTNKGTDKQFVADSLIHSTTCHY